MIQRKSVSPSLVELIAMAPHGLMRDREKRAIHCSADTLSKLRHDNTRSSQ